MNTEGTNSLGRARTLDARVLMMAMLVAALVTVLAGVFAHTQMREIGTWIATSSGPDLIPGP